MPISVICHIPSYTLRQIVDFQSPVHMEQQSPNVIQLRRMMPFRMITSSSFVSKLLPPYQNPVPVVNPAIISTKISFQETKSTATLIKDTCHSIKQPPEKRGPAVRQISACAREELFRAQSVMSMGGYHVPSSFLAGPPRGHLRFPETNRFRHYNKEEEGK